MKTKDKRKIYCVRYSNIDDLYYVVRGGKLTFNEATSIANTLNKSNRLNRRKEPANAT